MTPANKANPDWMVFQFDKEGAKARFCGFMSYSSCARDAEGKTSQIRDLFVMV